MKNAMQKRIKKYQHQKGVILVIALILMVVMALSAVAAVRLSGVDELMNSNTRSRVMALQAAEAAINYCKGAVFNRPANFHVFRPSGSTDEGLKWQDMSNWTDSTKVNSLNAELWGSKVTYRAQPECMVEEISPFVRLHLEDENNKVAAFRITARGFSPNYEKNAAGYQKAGAQAWLQIVVVRILN